MLWYSNKLSNETMDEIKLTRSVSNFKQVVVLGTPKNASKINGLITPCIQRVKKMEEGEKDGE